jgi:uncharacterized protein YggU (UPF0235/DUF167 family)
MAGRGGPVSRRAEGIALAILVQPRAAEDRLIGPVDGADGARRLKLRVGAAPRRARARPTAP